MTETALSVPVSELIPMLTAIADRNWEHFKELEKEFVTQHGVDGWEEFFELRVKPALDKESDRWLLIQWCSSVSVEG